MNSQSLSCLIISITPHFGYKRFLNIVNNEISTQDIIENPLKYKDILKLRDISIDFLKEKKYTEYIKVAKRWLKSNSINRIVTYFDDEYPDSLKQIPTPPLALYCMGNIDLLKTNQIAIVGSRKNTVYGKNATESIVKDLVESNITITSGLAYGIDTLSHKYTLENHGKTIAVIGTGIDIIYPSSNKALTDSILANNSLIISEFKFGTSPLKHNFPQRNRVISGLSKGILVIEAAQRSGTLITAEYALEQNRDIFAIPGSIFSTNSTGTNELIKQGAKLVCSANDILTEINMASTKSRVISDNLENLTQEQKTVLSDINHDVITTIDELVHKTKLTFVKVNEIIFDLEMESLIESVPGGYIRKNI